MSRRSALLRPPPTPSRPPNPFPGSPVIGRHRFPPPRRRRSRGGSPQFPGQPSGRSTPITPEGSSAPASGSRAPSMAFAVAIAARLPLGPPKRVRVDDACSGFTHVADRPVASAPLRTRPLDHAREPRYQGPGHLPRPDSHRLAVLSFSFGYATTTSSSSWRPNSWAHITKLEVEGRSPLMGKFVPLTTRPRSFPSMRRGGDGGG